jgi:hypothetical protein
VLEKHKPPVETLWDTNNLWLAFLFLCLCWVAIMVLIIHRDVSNLSQLERLQDDRAHLLSQRINLQIAEPGGQAFEDVTDQIREIDDRIAVAKEPPLLLFMVFSAFEGLFIAAYYVLLFKLRRQIRQLTMRIYLITLPVGFVYFFLLMTLFRFQTWSALLGDTLTYVVVGYFVLGLIAVSAKAVLWGERSDPNELGPAGGR